MFITNVDFKVSPSNIMRSRKLDNRLWELIKRYDSRYDKIVYPNTFTGKTEDVQYYSVCCMTYQTWTTTKIILELRIFHSNYILQLEVHMQIYKLLMKDEWNCAIPMRLSSGINDAVCVFQSKRLYFHDENETQTMIEHSWTLNAVVIKKNTIFKF